ncbi:uncharacterized protein LOC122039866 isoform X1 [Zingiber officinale]|uniref:Uncharacterized protein n=2 Tax=Zingiber officinale TaxID=94328 RepID=A0A8J5I749_ZINOF|nr:uncharacterized protein LOC122039866 isoform X1 [Zingiber officinale]KAG6528730.1 hypothetical protein ZIOFF_010915 [Zingiber officinale]
MGCWSPVDAMKAYLRTLQLCEEFYEYYEEEEVGIEPMCVEYISALAAGNRARVMVDVEPGGMSPSVIALAAAARQTGGRVVCLRREQEAGELLRRQAEGLGIADVVECRVAGRPGEAVERLRGVDFAVVDRGMGEEDCEEAVAAVDAGPRGAVVVVSILFDGGRRSPPGAAPAGGRTRVQMRGRSSSVVLPFGGGMEVIRIVGRRGDGDGGRRGKRRTFVVYYEDRETVHEDCVDLE